MQWLCCGVELRHLENASVYSVELSNKWSKRIRIETPRKVSVAYLWILISSTVMIFVKIFANSTAHFSCDLILQLYYNLRN